jgi:hypothetical protein
LPLRSRHRPDPIGEHLAALTPPEIRFAKKARDTRTDVEQIPPLPCGCHLARSPLYLCRTGAALNAALQLAEMLAVAIPNDPLLCKLAGLCREALTKHLVPPVPAGTTLLLHQTSDTTVEMTAR